MDAKIIKLQEIEKRYLEINDLLMKEEVVSDVKKYTKLSKEQAQLKVSYDAYQNYKKYTAIVEDGQEMLKDSDPEIREMAAMEIADAKENLEKLDKHIEELLLPRDPEDSYDCLVEIRGAAGGDEGNIFAGDLFRMYSYFAESLGYKVEVMESSEGEAGGYALISFAVKGLDAYRHFKFESGAHRVQRVPKTETQGRVHTSTATVIVFPDVEDEDVEIPDSDLEIETHRASGAGGQHIARPTLLSASSTSRPASRSTARTDATRLPTRRLPSGSSERASTTTTNRRKRKRKVRSAVPRSERVTVRKRSAPTTIRRTAFPTTASA